MSRTPVLVALSTAAALALTGCGGGESAAPADLGQQSGAVAPTLGADEGLTPDQRALRDAAARADGDDPEPPLKPRHVTIVATASDEAIPKLRYVSRCTTRYREGLSSPWYQLIERVSNCDQPIEVEVNRYRENDTTKERTYIDSVSCRLLDGDSGSVLVEQSTSDADSVTCSTPQAAS